MLKRLCVALTLLTGCREAKPPAPSAPGTSLALTYPAVLIGQGDVAVRDDVVLLTSTTLASGLNFIERKIVDSSGTIYEIKQAIPVTAPKAWWRDMGTSQQAYFLDLRKSEKSSFEDVRRLVLEQLSSPQGIWQGNANASAKVKGFKTVAEVIEGCRTSWDWNN